MKKLLVLLALLFFGPVSAQNSNIPNGGGGGGGGGGGAVTQSGNWYVGTYTIPASAFVAPTVTASSAYASGNVVGGILTFPNMGRAAGATGMITSVTLNFQDQQNGTWDLLIFDSLPGGTYTDKTAVSVPTTDINKLIKVVHVADCTSTGTTSQCQADGIGKNYLTTSTTNMYGVLVTRGAPTFGVTNDIQIRMHGQEN